MAILRGGQAFFMLCIWINCVYLGHYRIKNKITMTKVKDIFSKAGRNRCPARFSGSDKWNPNRPAQFTQEEFLEHIHEIEKGPFTPLDIANREFEEWKVEFLRNQKPDVPKHYLGFSFDRLSDH